MSNQSITNEDVFIVHLFSSDEMMTPLERKCYNSVIDILVRTGANGGEIDDEWTEDCEAAFWHFVENDPYWSNQGIKDQKRFVAASTLKVSIFVELFFESLIK